jgi:hypothetical protein
LRKSKKTLPKKLWPKLRNNTNFRGTLRCPFFKINGA